MYRGSAVSEAEPDAVEILNLKVPFGARCHGTEVAGPIICKVLHLSFGVSQGVIPVYCPSRNRFAAQSRQIADEPVSKFLLPLHFHVPHKLVSSRCSNIHPSVFKTEPHPGLLARMPEPSEVGKMDIRLPVWIKGVSFPVSPAKPPERSGLATEHAKPVGLLHNQASLKCPSEPVQNFIPQFSAHISVERFSSKFAPYLTRELSSTWFQAGRPSPFLEPRFKVMKVLFSVRVHWSQYS